jgi:hypothetical protein
MTRAQALQRRDKAVIDAADACAIELHDHIAGTQASPIRGCARKGKHDQDGVFLRQPEGLDGPVRQVPDLGTEAARLALRGHRRRIQRLLRQGLGQRHRTQTESERTEQSPRRCAPHAPLPIGCQSPGADTVTSS